MAGVRLADDTTTLSSCLIIIHRVHLSAREGTAGHGNPNKTKMSPAGTLTSHNEAVHGTLHVCQMFLQPRGKERKKSRLCPTPFSGFRETSGKVAVWQQVKQRFARSFFCECAVSCCRIFSKKKTKWWQQSMNRRRQQKNGKSCFCF